MQRVLSILFCLCTLVILSAYGQDTSSLAGTVRDASGAVVRRATVTLTSQTKGSSLDSQTNGDGAFSFPFVPPDTYTLSVEAQGFKRYQRTDIPVVTAQRSTVDARLEVGGPQETVTVSSDRVLMNQTDGSVGAVIDRTLVENIPLNGRSLQSLWTLVPGVNQVATGESPSAAEGTITVNGQRAQSNQFLVDGVSANVPPGGGYDLVPNIPSLNAVGGTQGLVTVDELSEFKVLTSSYSAEYGTSPGGQFSMTTRSGTNALHGSGYEFLRNEDVDANDWFANNQGFPRGELRQNQFGGTLGGPVVLPHLYNGHDKTFFFGAFEALQLVTPVTQIESVPDMALRSSAYPALQPLLNEFPVPNGPDLGGGIADYTLQAAQPSTVYTGAGRIDHVFSPKIQSFVRYSRSPSTTSPIDTDGSFFDNVVSQMNSQSLTAGLTWVPTSNLGNDLRFNWSTSSNHSGEQSRVNQNLFPYFSRDPNNPPDSEVILVFELEGGIIALEQGYSMSSSSQFNVVDAASWTKGRHSFRFGGNLRRLSATVAPNTYLAEARFYSVASVNSGVTDGLYIDSTVKAEPVFYDYGLFVNDEWTVSNALRLQLGLRWDVNPVPGSVNGLSPTVFTGGPDFTTITVQPPGTPLYHTRYANFAPRVGLAYRFGKNNGFASVLRLGGGLFYDTSDNGAASNYQAYPFGNEANYSNVQFPYSATVTAAPSPSVPPVPPYGSIQAIDPHLRLPVTYSWSAAVEQELGPRSTAAITYVGNAGRQLSVEGYLLNVQNANDVLYTTNGGNSSYNAMQVQYQARLLHGLTAFGNYTWSHSIDDEDIQQTSYSYTPIRGNSDADQRDIFRLGLSYTGPRVAGNLRSLLLSEWGTDMNIGIQTGLPFNLRAGYQYLPNAKYQYVRPNVVPGVQQWIPNPSAPGGWQLNINAFSVPPVGADGNSAQGNMGRNVLYGFSTGQADVAIRKVIPLTESVRLQFRAEAFNLTNHPNFADYNTYVDPTSTTLGQAQSMLGTALGGLNPLYQTGGPRSMQFALKLLF